MTRRPMHAPPAGFWTLGLLGVVVFVVVSRGAAMPDGIVLAALGILPPILLWFWWNDPEPTMSQSIHEVRNGASSRAPVNRDS
jgi:hypothetical protein